MIGHISGKVIKKSRGVLLVDVGGVGYRISIPSDTFDSLKKNSQINLWTHLSVRETAMDLYGFDTEKALEFFQLLIGVSGIGPKSALAIISLATIDTLSSAISSGDTSYLTKVSGIGKKSAEKIVLELKDKIGGDRTEEDLRDESDALEALHSLGYTIRQSRDALKKVGGSVSGTSEKVKSALSILGNSN